MGAPPVQFALKIRIVRVEHHKTQQRVMYHLQKPLPVRVPSQLLMEPRTILEVQNHVLAITPHHRPAAQHPVHVQEQRTVTVMEVALVEL